MDIGNKKIILARGSPRRRELLAGLDIEFEIDTRNSFEESYSSNTPHRKIPVLMAEGKSSGFHRPILKDEILITADTMVLCGNRKMRTNVPSANATQYANMPIIKYARDERMDIAELMLIHCRIHNIGTLAYQDIIPHELIAKNTAVAISNIPSTP